MKFQATYLSLLFIMTPTIPFLTADENYQIEFLQTPHESIEFSKAPSWVEEIAYDSENYEENIIEPGYALLLTDGQVNFDEKIYYHREARKIISKTALASSFKIPIIFCPHNSQLVVHSLKIIREGEIIDKLATAKRKIFPSCSSNSTHIDFYLDNLHVGDIIEYSFSYKFKKTPTNKLLHGCEFAVKPHLPHKKITYSCLLPPKTYLSWKTHLFEQDPVCTVKGPLKKYFWEMNYSHIDFLPPRDFPKLYFSQPSREPSIAVSITTWKEIARYYALLLDEKTHFSGSPPQKILELVENWQNVYPNVEDQILAAIRLVSDDIYCGSFPDNEREHLITPYSPEEIFENYYGDCKDKSSLLIAILKLLDVEAYPVLVHTEKTYQLKDDLPDFLFNHLIARVDYNGKSYFIDPTIPLLGGTLDTYQVPDLGYGLVLKEDTEDLTPITRNFLSKVQSSSTISLQGDQGTWEHEAQFSHQIANLIRETFVPEGIPKESKNLLISLHNLYPKVRGVYSSPLEVADNRDTNSMTKNFAISFENLGEETPNGTLFNFSPFLDYLCDNETRNLLKNKNLSHALSLETYKKFVEEQDRTFDIYCDKPSHVEEKKVHYTDENMSYTLTVEKISATHIHVALYQKFFTSYIEVDKLPQFYKKLEEFKNHLTLTIEIPN